MVSVGLSTFSVPCINGDNILCPPEVDGESRAGGDAVVVQLGNTEAVVTRIKVGGERTQKQFGCQRPLVMLVEVVAHLKDKPIDVAWKFQRILLRGGEDPTETFVEGHVPCNNSTLGCEVGRGSPPELSRRWKVASLGPWRRLL